MLKKILIGLGILVIVFSAFVLSYYFYFTRLSSPEANVHFENQHVQIDVNYCQPSTNGRLIFGPKEDGALVPFGKYWRLGANQATEIEFSQAVLFKDQEVEAGRYRMYAIPDENTWVVRLNTQINEWGANQPDHSFDVTEVEVSVIDSPKKEVFTITISEIEKGALLKMHWDETAIEIPITTIN